LNVARNELKELSNKRIPLERKNLSEKDQDLLKKVNILAGAVEVPKPPVIGVDVRETDELKR